MEKLKLIKCWKTLLLLFSMSMISTTIFAQVVTLRGRVTDKKGEALIGATVRVGGTTNGGTTTDISGNFTLRADANVNSLNVTYVGYVPLTVPVKAGTTNVGTLILANDANNLSEVVVVGYGVQKKSSVTGAIAAPVNTRMYDRTQGSITCNENLKFKTQFFDHIAVVEKHTNENVAALAHTIKTTAFKDALAFLTKYTKVPVIVPGDAGYKILQTFKADKSQWLKWYEANKCNNLK